MCRGNEIPHPSWFTNPWKFDIVGENLGDGNSMKGHKSAPYTCMVCNLGKSLRLHSCPFGEVIGEFLLQVEQKQAEQAFGICSRMCMWKVW